MFNCNIYSVSWNIVITKVPLRIAHAVIILKIHPREGILLHMYIYLCMYHVRDSISITSQALIIK